jgi:lysophospholipase L1-like esterase
MPVSITCPGRSPVLRGGGFSPKKVRSLLFVMLHVAGFVSLASCSWRTSGEGSGSPPAVHTRSASAISTDRAVLVGAVNPNGSAVDAWFEYGTDPALATWTATPRQAKRSVMTPLSFRASVHGFSPYTTYYYRAVARNRLGTRRGDIRAFPTGEYYVAVGDSITRAGGGKGYEPTLSDLLRNSKKYPNTVANWGVDGATSLGGAISIAMTLSTVPGANYFLIMYGTNDARRPAPVPSGRGKRPGDLGYRGSYKDNLQRIISVIRSAGKIPYLAMVPYTTMRSIDISSIREYNEVVDELVAENDIAVTPPDFFSYFREHPDEIPDGIHPNRTGYESMANLWFIALTQKKVPVPSK